jgi:hypothetical protein
MAQKLWLSTAAPVIPSERPDGFSNVPLLQDVGPQ